jgi:hypothetical protein
MSACLNRFAAALAVGVLWASVGAARADSVLFYNGDPDESSGAVSTIAGLGGTGIVYDDFVVPTGATWTVSSVFTNDYVSMDPSGADFIPSLAKWTIREGVSYQDGGTVVDSGVGSANVTANSTNLVGYNGYTIAVLGLNFTLSAGTYWLAVTPIDGTGTNFAYAATATGPGGSDSYVAGSYYYGQAGFNFDYASNYSTNANGAAIFSMGMTGSVSSVPEPSALAMGLIGACGIFGLVRIDSIKRFGVKVRLR